MGILDRYVVVRIVAAEPESLLCKLVTSNIELWDVCFLDLLTVEIKIRKQQMTQFDNVIRRYGGTYSVVKKDGVLWYMHSIIKRPVFLIGTLLFLLISMVAPNRIYFVKVKGNDQIPGKQIITQVEALGIRFGAKISKIRSEEIKNQLLGSMPKLQWVGITTSGSTAIIHVTERSTQNEVEKRGQEVSSVVAARDGVITQMTVEKGTPLFSVGQTVAKDDVLVSGYTDCGLKIIADSAVAEVFAHTLRENQFISPMCTAQRGVIIDKSTCYQLQIGKKVIKLCNHSGISDATCVKMYSENYWTLPGGFQLPVSVKKVETLRFMQTKWNNLEEATCQWLPQFARSYLLQQMVAGTILNEDSQLEVLDDACILAGTYACNEMIGQVKYEEIIEQNAEDN